MKNHINVSIAIFSSLFIILMLPVACLIQNQTVSEQDTKGLPQQSLAYADSGEEIMSTYLNNQNSEEKDVVTQDQKNNTTGTSQPGQLAIKAANSTEETPPLLSLPLLLSLNQVSRADYVARYGEPDPQTDPVAAAAVKIAQVTINQELFQPGFLKSGDDLLISGFQDTTYRVTVDTVNTGQQTFTLNGKKAELPGGSLALTYISPQVLAELHLPGLNKLLTVRYNQVSARHYLYEAFLNEIAIIEEDGLLIPPAD